MLRIKSRFMKLFVSLVFLLLPIFFVYLFMTQSILRTLKSETDTASMAQLAQTGEALTLLYQSYSDTSVQLSTQTELLRYRMLSGEISASKGIERLADVKSYDAALFDLFMYYDSGKIYSALGLSPYPVYFSQTLGCDENSAARAAEVLMDTHKGVCFLEQKAGSGFLLYHYPVRWNTGGATVSVNFLVPVSALKNILAQLLKNCGTYITVSFSGGESLTFFGNAQDSLSLTRVPAGTADALNAGRYTGQTLLLEQSGTTLSVYYEAGALYRDVNARQVVSYVAMAALLLLSVCVSYVLSKKYHHPIHQLAARIASLREHSAPAWHKTDELDYLNETFGLMMDEKDRMSRGLKEFKGFIRPQIALMLFHGLLKEPVVIQKMLELCDFEFHEDYYLVMTVMAVDCDKETAQGIHALLQTHFREDLCSPISVNGETALSILTGIPSPDYAYSYRKKIEETLRNVCDPYKRVILCFSRIYTDIVMVSHAFLEAVTGIKDILMGDAKALTVYADQLESTQADITAPKLNGLEQLEEALREQDEDAAVQCLHSLFHHLEYDPYASGTKRYLRYRIVQKLIEVIQESAREHDRSGLLSEAMAINPADEGKFDEIVTALVKKVCFSPQKEDEIQLAIQYIQKNFSKYDLSLDEVAGYVGLSKSYLSKLFKVKTGRRYIDYISEIRLEEAKRLLAETQLSVQEIVCKVGYYDVTSFSRKFKAAYGVNTSYFRTQTPKTFIP